MCYCINIDLEFTVKPYVQEAIRYEGKYLHKVPDLIKYQKCLIITLFRMKVLWCRSEDRLCNELVVEEVREGEGSIFERREQV